MAKYRVFTLGQLPRKKLSKAKARQLLKMIDDDDTTRDDLVALVEANGTE